MEIIRVDCREDTKVINTLIEQLDHRVHPEQLKVGDVVFGNVCIERKAWADFIASCYDQRIFRQAENMVANYKHNYLVVEGLFSERFKDRYVNKISDEFILSTIATIQHRYGINYMQVENTIQFAKYINALVKKHTTKGSVEIVERVGFKKEPLGVRFWMLFPSIGIKTARKIYKYQNPIKTIEIKADSLLEIDGIGKKTVDKIVRYINGEKQI